MSSPSISMRTKFEDYTISASLNGSMLLSFLMGTYTMAYCGTVYVYISKKSANANRRIVLIAISVLYLICFANFILQWYFVDWSFVIHGDTGDSISSSVLERPSWFQVFENFLLNASLVVSDGLLTWRCYHVWAKSRKVIVLPTLFLAAESALAVLDVALDPIFLELNQIGPTATENVITTGLVFISLGTTAYTTIFIALRIFTASQSNIPKSQKTYIRIITTIVESSGVYSLVLLFFALTGVITMIYARQPPVLEALSYSQVLLTIISGMAPTIMVARLALISSSNTVSSVTITHTSGLNVGSQPRSGGTGGANTTSGVVNPSMHIEDPDHKKLPVVDLTKEANMHGTIEDSAV